MTTLATSTSTPVPVFDAVAIRAAREASLKSTSSANIQQPLTTATSPGQPQPYPLITPSLPIFAEQPTAPSTDATATTTPVHTVPAPVVASALISPIIPSVAATCAPAQGTASSAAPLPVQTPTSPIVVIKQESQIDPNLLALDTIAESTTTALENAALVQQLISTQPLDLPFQAPLFDIAPVPTGATPSPFAARPIAAPSTGADLLARAHLTLHTALDAGRFGTYSAGSSSTASYPSNSIAGTGPSSTLDNSPVTPSGTDADGESEYEPGNNVPAGRKTALVAGGVPAPKVKQKKSHARKQPEGHVKRARNAFILFRKHITDSNLIPPSVEVKHQNISVVAAKMWKEAPVDVRAKFQEMARLEKEEHQRKYPNYRYQPVFRRTDIIRRRVRKDGAEDEKVEAVAEALIKGKAGGELEKEIKDQALVGEDVDISPEGSAARSRSRRRRDPGQLSKGAMRAQKAQNRQKAMRANLLGHNLLSMSLYNAQQQQMQQQHAEAMAAHAHAGLQTPGMHHAYAGHPGHAHYGPAGEMEYMPGGGYEVEGGHMVDVYGNPMPGAYEGYPDGNGHGPYGPGQEYPEDMYHLPSMVGYDDQPAYDLPRMDQFYTGPNQHGAEYDGMDQASPYGHGPQAYGHGPDGQGGHEDGYMQGYDMLDMDTYNRLPPLLHHVASPSDAIGHYSHDQADRGEMSMPTSAIPGGDGGGLHARVQDEEDGDQGDDPRVMREWGMGGLAEQQQTPSGHVVFDEGLFEGQVGMAGKAADGLGDFEDAVQQANEMW